MFDFHLLNGRGFVRSRRRRQRSLRQRLRLPVFAVQVAVEEVAARASTWPGKSDDWVQCDRIG